jgi:hypothetical protein
VKPLIYDARGITCHNNSAEQKLIEELKKKDPNMGVAHMAATQNSTVKLVDTTFGKCKVGSFLSYQVSVTESNFRAEADLDEVPRLPNPIVQPLVYPHFPLRDQEELRIPDTTSDDEKKVISDLTLEEENINTIEKETRKQAECEKWKNERKFRFTASKFHLISRRQRNHETFAETIINPKSISSRHLEHGRKYEPVALLEYDTFMYNRRTPVQVLGSGLVILKAVQYLELHQMQK